MGESTHADRYLLDEIRRGSADGWSELVSRYEGRLTAFARSRLGRSADAEDFVQETFIHFLRGLPRFREDASVETYLFTILRRKLIDWFRGQKLRACSLSDQLDPKSGEPDLRASQIPAADPTASWHVRHDEQLAINKRALADALNALLDRCKQADNLRDVRVAEMLFYGQLRNKDVAAVAKIDEKHVALIKHRFLNEVRAHIAGRAVASGATLNDLEGNAELIESLLTETWEDERLTCPKRSTLGRHLLGTLDPAWADLVEFHVNRLGCRFCQANLEDLKRDASPPSPMLREKILHSTIGFFRRDAASILPPPPRPGAR